MMPVLLAVATDESRRAALDAVLRRRFESDYSVVVSGDPADGLDLLGRYRDSGEQVAIVVALFHMRGRDGIPFLIAAHQLHPSAQRVLIIGVGDVSAAHDLNQALTLNQVDFYLGEPWESPEEEVYPVLGEALHVWAREHQLRYNKAFIVDAANAVARSSSPRLARAQRGRHDSAAGRLRPGSRAAGETWCRCGPLARRRAL